MIDEKGSVAYQIVPAAAAAAAATTTTTCKHETTCLAHTHTHICWYTSEYKRDDVIAVKKVYTDVIILSPSSLDV